MDKGNLIGALDAAERELWAMLECITSPDGCAGDWHDHKPGIRDALKQVRRAKREQNACIPSA